MTVEHEHELEGLKAAGRLVARTLEAMGKALEPGITPRELDQLGRRMLDVEGTLQPHRIFEEFARASAELWNNLLAPFTDATMHWQNFDYFWSNYFLPYLVGGVGPGLAASVVGYYLTVPVIRAYHKRRSRKMAERIARVQDAPQPATPPEDDKG